MFIKDFIYGGNKLLIEYISTGKWSIYLLISVIFGKTEVFQARETDLTYSAPYTRGL